MAFHYIPQPVRLWLGRYSRIPGSESVLHVVLSSVGPDVCLYWTRNDGKSTCRAIPPAENRRLASGVNEAKRFLGGQHGGSFLINEFGQVLVPSQDGSGRIAIAGRIEGNLQFEDPSKPGRIVDLSDDAGLTPGSPWNLPYVGMPYNLHNWGRIYFWKEDLEGARSEYAPVQDEALVRALRTVRPSGGVRFIVNPAGLVLTKVPGPASETWPQQWSAVYVGRIKRSEWFAEER